MLRCVKGNIGLDGVRYSIGDVFDADDNVADALINGNFAEEVVADTPVKESVIDDNPDLKEPVKPKRGRKVAVSK